MFSVGPLKVGRLKLGMCADPIQVLLNWSKLWTSFWLGVFKSCNFWSGFDITFLYALILKYIWCLKFFKTSKIQQPSVAANFLSCTNCAKFCFSTPRYLWYTITFVLCQTHTLYYFIKCPILIVFMYSTLCWSLLYYLYRFLLIILFVSVLRCWPYFYLLFILSNLFFTTRVIYFDRLLKYNEQQ